MFILCDGGKSLAQIKCTSFYVGKNHSLFLHTFWSNLNWKLNNDLYNFINHNLYKLFLPRPHCAVMAACDFDRRQSIFMSLHFVLSNTTRLAPFCYGDTRVQGSAKGQRMPARIVQADLDNLSRPVHTHARMSFNREWWSWWRCFHA